MKKAYSMFLLMFVISFSAMAQSLSASQLLQRDILVSSKTLTNDVYIYNYFNLQQAWPELDTAEGRRNYVQRYLMARAGSFWDFGFTDNSPKFYAAGAALYFAIDPLISKSFGNTFIEIKISAGSRFVNVVNPVPLKKDTLTALEQEGYISKADIPLLFPKQTGFYRDTLRMMVLPEYAKFRTLVHEIFAANQIQFVEYNFNTSLMGFCKQHSYSAFAFIGLQNQKDMKNAIMSPDYQNVNLYSDAFSFANVSPAENAAKARITKFRDVLTEVNAMLKRGQKSQAVQAYILSQYSADEYTSLKTSTFSCK